MLLSLKCQFLLLPLFGLDFIMKNLHRRLGFNFEYSLLIAIFAGLLVFCIGALSKPTIKDGAAWVQAICGICTLIAVLAIAAIQRKHAYLQSMEDFEIYTLKAYQVASQAVIEISELTNSDKLMVSDQVERQLIKNGLAVLYEAVNGFEVSNISSAVAAIALLRIKQQIKDVETVYLNTCLEDSDKLSALARLRVISDSASKELDVLKSEVSLLEKEDKKTWRKKLRIWMRKNK